MVIWKQTMAATLNANKKKDLNAVQLIYSLNAKQFVEMTWDEDEKSVMTLTQLRSKEKSFQSAKMDVLHVVS